MYFTEMQVQSLTLVTYCFIFNVVDSQDIKKVLGSPVETAVEAP